MPRVITFGEIMLRLVPPDSRRFLQATAFEASYGGGEANVALSLAMFGIDAAFVTKLPENELGQAAVNTLRQFGVDTRLIVRGGPRMGVYYLETGASQRPSKVIYDRAGSSFATAAADEFDWKRAFAGAEWFHFSGITPALSDAAADACLAACRAAKAAGARISCDLNYRANLWTRERAGRVMTGLMPYVDLCIANRGAADDVFGIRAGDADPHVGAQSAEACFETARLLRERFGFRLVALTMRESVSASDNNFAAILDDGERRCVSKKYALRIVDRVGGGDAFDAGLVYALLSGFEPGRAVEFASAASALKHSIRGDFNLATASEVAALAGGASGEVRR